MMDHYLSYQGLRHTRTCAQAWRARGFTSHLGTSVHIYAHMHAYVGYQPEKEDEKWGFACACARTQRPEPLGAGMLMFSKETITQHRNRD